METKEINLSHKSIITEDYCFELYLNVNGDGAYNVNARDYLSRYGAFY